MEGLDAIWIGERSSVAAVTFIRGSRAPKVFTSSFLASRIIFGVDVMCTCFRCRICTSLCTAAVIKDKDRYNGKSGHHSESVCPIDCVVCSLFLPFLRPPAKRIRTRKDGTARSSMNSMMMPNHMAEYHLPWYLVCSWHQTESSGHISDLFCLLDKMKVLQMYIFCKMGSSK